MAELGSIVLGTVTGITKFGAFVDLEDGESGLVHISEISHEYVEDINQVINKNDKVKVKVIKIDDNGKISLSIKQAQPKPERKSEVRKSARPDSFDWTAKNDENLSFEDRLSRFKHESEEILRDNKRRMDNRRSGGYSKKGR